MNNITLTEIWEAQQAQIEKTQQLNLFLVRHLQETKTASQLNSLARFKVFAVVTGIIWMALLALLTVGSIGHNWYFTVSVGMIFLFTLLAVIFYIRHITLIRSLDYSGPITATQEKLAGLQLSTINGTRILWLQLPFYTTFFWTHELVTGDRTFQLVAIPITLAFTALAIWLYRNISAKNLHKKWLKAYLNAGPEYKNLVKASEFLSELDDFKK